YLTIVFSLLTSYLSALSTLEFLHKLRDPSYDADSNDFTQSMVIGLALSAAALAVLPNWMNVIYTTRYSVRNARSAASHIENRDFPNNKYTYATIIVGTLGSVVLPPVTFYSLSNAFKKIPWIKTWSVSYAHVPLAVVGSTCITLSHLLTQFPPLY